MTIEASISGLRNLYSALRFALFLPIFFAGSCEKTYPTFTTTNISKYNEQFAAIFVPANPNDSTNAYGNVSAVYNSFTHEFNYNIHWNHLTSFPIAIHFNDKDSIMIALPVFPRVLTDSVSGGSFITSRQADDLSSGYVFVMIHTINYPYGEVMASMNKQ